MTILRGTPRERTVTEPCNATSERQMPKAGVIGTGSNLWYVDSDGRIHACWLSGTGYVNSLRVVCSPSRLTAYVQVHMRAPQRS